MEGNYIIVKRKVDSGEIFVVKRHLNKWYTWGVLGFIFPLQYQDMAEFQTGKEADNYMRHLLREALSKVYKKEKRDRESQKETFVSAWSVP